MDPLRYDYHTFDPDEVSGIVASMIPQGARVLDVGCGTGALDQILSRQCQAEIVGIEPDQARAEVARLRGFNIQQGPLRRQLIREIGLFDIVLFADVIEHLPNPQTILRSASEALKNGGAVIVSVPNVAHWSVRVDLLRGRFQYRDCGIMDATHLRWFTLASFKALVESAGFRVTKCRATAGIGLLDNNFRRPLKWLPPNQRARVLRWGCKHWPTLLGTQYVLKAER